MCATEGAQAEASHYRSPVRRTGCMQPAWIYTPLQPTACLHICRLVIHSTSFSFSWLCRSRFDSPSRIIQVATRSRRIILCPVTQHVTKHCLVQVLHLLRLNRLFSKVTHTRSCFLQVGFNLVSGSLRAEVRLVFLSVRAVPLILLTHTQSFQ